MGTAGTVLSQMSHIVIVSVVVYFSNSATFFLGSGTTLPFSRNSLFLTEVSDKITAKICNIHVFFLSEMTPSPHPGSFPNINPFWGMEASLTNHPYSNDYLKGMGMITALG